jgi:hypothetical protein
LPDYPGCAVLAFVLTEPADVPLLAHEVAVVVAVLAHDHAIDVSAALAGFEDHGVTSS